MELYKIQRRIKGIALTFGALNIIFIILWSIILFEVFLPKGQLNPTPTTSTTIQKTTIPTTTTTTKTTLISMPSSLPISTTQTIEIETSSSSSTSTTTQENTEITDKVSSTTETESTEKPLETTISTTTTKNVDSSTEISSSEKDSTDHESIHDLLTSTSEISSSEKDLTTTDADHGSTTEIKKESSDEEMQSDQAVTDTVPVFSIPIVEKKSLNDIIEEKIDNEDGTSFHQVVFKPTIKTKAETETTTETTTKSTKVPKTKSTTTTATTHIPIAHAKETTTTGKSKKKLDLDPIIEDLEKEPEYYVPPPRSRKSESGSPRFNKNLNRNLYEYSSDPNIDSTRYFEERIRQQRDDPESEFETSYHQMYKRSVNWSRPSKLLQCSSLEDKLAIVIVSIWSLIFGLINLLSSVLLFKGGKVKSYYKTQISLYLTALTLGMTICSIIYLILLCTSEFPPNNKLLNQPGRLGLGINIFNLFISVLELCATCLYLQTLARCLPMVSLTNATTIQLAKL